VRILYLNPNGFLGGAERALLDLMGSVQQARPDWSLELATGSHGDFSAAARALGINVNVVPFPAAFGRLGDSGVGEQGNLVSKAGVLGGMALTTPQVAAYVLKLRAFIASRDPNVIHSNGFKSHILAAWAAPRRSKILWHVHDYVSSRHLMSRMMRIHAGGCAVAIANSHSVARDLQAACAGRLKNIRTVHNAVDLERFSPRGPMLDLDSMAGLPSAPAGAIRVGLIATMARWKGHEAFLRALAMLPSRLAFRGYVIGGPIYETLGSQRSLGELRRFASGLGLNGNVGFTGFLTDAPAAIRALDIVVHASTQPEPFGLAVAEAMACGKPVIASNAGGVNEIISENETALVYCPGDVEAMAACIERLVSDRSLRIKLGDYGRRRAGERFDRSRLAQQVPPIYESAARFDDTGTAYRPG
jgi:glycosyltransferase involved in cell wall biosynthesis